MSIREKRQAAGMSQSRLAILAGLTAGMVCDFERGARRPWPKARRSLAEALGCTEAELFPDLAVGGE